MARWRMMATLIGVLALGACAAQQPGGASSAPAVTPVKQTPSDLVGLWRVQASGEDSGAILRLGDDLSLWHRCDELFGAWQAGAGGGFLGTTDSSSYECAGPKVTAAPKPAIPATPATPAWLVHAAAWRADGNDRVLLDEHGAVVACLTPSGEPSKRHVAAHELYAKPVLDAALQRRLTPAAPLPANLTPATAANLVDDWKPAATGQNAKQYLKIKADGSWEGSDGCNIQIGRWALDGPGTVLTIGGGSTLVGCAGQDTAPRFADARHAGFDGTTLVLTDAQGKEVGRLQR